MGKNYLKLGLLITLAIGLFWGLKQTTAQNPKTTTIKYNPKKSTLYTPVTKPIEETITLAGSIDTDQIANLRFQNSGKLVWVGVKIGDRVRKWQAIASLDREQLKKSLQTQFNNYRTQLSQFQDTQDTYKSTREKYLVTDTIQRILDRTQYSLDNSVITYEIADMAIKESTIYSPIEGIVIGVDQPLPGINVTPATATFTIVNPQSLYLKAEIDQEAVTRVKIGQPVTITLDSYPDKTIESKISYISFTPVSGQTSTVYEIRFPLPVIGNITDYRLGMDGNIDITLAQSDDALTIPTDAVSDDNGASYVYVKDGNNLKRVDIQTGITTDTTTQVTEGLSINDQVVVIQK